MGAGLNGPTILILAALALGYYTVDKVKEPVKKAAHSICHVVTLGHKCESPKPAK